MRPKTRGFAAGICDDEQENRTRQQMEEEMRQLRKVFMTVRLMKADEVQGGKKGSAPAMPSGGAASV